MKKKGKLVRADLGAGGWMLETDDGETYQLDGDIPASLAGKRVEVKGKKSGGFGFVMGGPTLQVESISGD